MKQWMSAGACLLFGLAPLSAVACSYHDAATSASATPASRLAMAQPEASRLPSSIEARTVAPQDMKKVVSKRDQAAAAPAERRTPDR